MRSIADGLDGLEPKTRNVERSVRTRQNRYLFLTIFVSFRNGTINGRNGPVEEHYGDQLHSVGEHRISLTGILHSIVDVIDRIMIMPSTSTK